MTRYFETNDKIENYGCEASLKVAIDIHMLFLLQHNSIIHVCVNLPAILGPIIIFALKNAFTNGF